MKKQVVLLLVTMIVPLSGCSNAKWSWWETENVTIVREMPIEDAKAALDSSFSNARLVKSFDESYTKNIFYKNYLGYYTTEEDYNLNESSTRNVKVYDNNALVSNSVQTVDQTFLHGYKASTIKTDTYTFSTKKEIKSDIRVIESKNHGYKDNEVKEIEFIPFTTEEAFDSKFIIGSDVSSSLIAGKSCTYGFANNNSVIVEIMETKNSDNYTIKFNGQTYPIVVNTYTMYRLKPIEVTDKDAQYVVDYFHKTSQQLIGFNAYGEALKEPYVLAKEETVRAYQTTSNGDYDYSNIPEVNTK